METLTRRDFAKAAAAIGITAAAGVASGQSKSTTKAATTTISPANRIRLGIIGVGNRGDRVLDGFLAQQDAQVVAISDLYQPYLDFAAKKVGTPVDQYTDYRRLLDRKDIDAVVIATPDHWHALQMIHACQAGKDVYVEKPLSLTVAEGRAMVNAARRHKRVTQVGTQRRSSPICKEMIDFIRKGGIGKITTARAFHIQNESPHGIGRPSDSEPPANLDWDTWLGPAPQRPYNRNRTLYRFRWFYDYSGGQVTNTGTHYLDIIQWALGQDAPRSVTCMGGKFADFDDREIPDTLEALWTYDNGSVSGGGGGGTLVTFSQFNASSPAAAAKPCEIEFRGTKGTIYFNGAGYEVVPETPTSREYPILNPLDRAGAKGWKDGKPMIEAKQRKAGSSDPVDLHARNFLDCVKSRARCNADIETGHRSTSATHLANIALKTRAMLEWDAKAERFTNSEDANKLLSYEYRKPYELPA
jgi:predicted dehydrogenase